ncbi:MAG: hypothetical protein QXX95_02500 [Nitrososphaerales archaeon]
MDWKGVDERLIKRGELLLSLDFLEGYDTGLMGLKDGKIIIPLRLPLDMLSSSLLYFTFSPRLIGSLKASLRL